MARPIFSLPITFGTQTTAQALNAEVNRVVGSVYNGAIAAASDPAVAQAVADSVADDSALAIAARDEAVAIAGKSFDTMDDFAAWTPATYPATGTIVTVRATGFAYEVLATDAPGADRTLTSGVKLRVLSGNALAYGASGDGVTNDSAAFNRIEAADTGPVVDLGGRTYVLTSFWTDPAGGVLLTKDYVNGSILMDGRPYVQDLQRGLGEAGAYLSPTAATGKSLGLFRRDENTYFVWSPLGGRYWAAMQLSRTVTGVPFNWRETVIQQRLGIIGARDGSTHTYTGSWAAAGVTFDLSASDAVSYISGRAQQGITVGDFVDITYQGGGDLFVVFTGRTSGNFVNVLLDGGQDYLVLPDDGAGNRYFDSYTSVDLSHRQIVQIASGVPAGSHTIRLTVSVLRHPSSTGTRYVHNALAFSDVDTGPWTPETDAPTWVTGQAVLRNQVRQWLGRYYYASADGATGATPPTHTTGSVSDGGVTWIWRAAGGYDLPSHRFHAIGSQLEYAYEIRPNGAATKNDVGGAMHGNETQVSADWHVGRSVVSLPDRTWAVGESVSIREAINATHSEVGAGLIPVVETVLSRDFRAGCVSIRHEHELLTAAELGYFYSHMWPLLHYSSIGAKYGITEIWSPGDGWRTCADFYGANNPFVGRTKDFVMEARGPCLQPDGLAGVPSTGAAPLLARFGLRVWPEGVDKYQQVGGRVFSSKAMNTNGADVSAGGFASMTSKMYFERNSSQVPQQYAVGEIIRCRADYMIGLELAK